LPILHLIIAGCYDSLSAKILQQAGHQAAYVSGAAVSATQLGEPDLGLLTPPEMSRRTSQICNSIPDFPVIADADTGGGTILNVQRTIRALIAAGASGCVLEDQKWPKSIGYQRNKEVAHREEFVAKILAAREAIGDEDFFLIARTDARSTSAKHGLEDAIARANLYMDAGADAHLIGGVRSVDELSIIGEKTYGLRVANMVEGGVTPLCTTAQLKDMGFNAVVFPLSAIFAASRALVEVYGALAEDGSSQKKWNSMVSWRAFNDILGIEDRLMVDDHFTKVKGPASNIGPQLRVKVKGLVKPISVQ
jgi:2-methylisocitrate lyase-like PEP mutase family enzyme